MNTMKSSFQVLYVIFFSCKWGFSFSLRSFRVKKTSSEFCHGTLHLFWNTFYRLRSTQLIKLQVLDNTLQIKIMSQYFTFLMIRWIWWLQRLCTFINLRSITTPIAIFVMVRYIWSRITFIDFLIVEVKSEYVAFRSWFCYLNLFYKF